MRVGLVILFLGLSVCNAQLHDAQWITGPATSAIDFRNDTIVTYTINMWMNMKLTNAAVSNENGELLFYTNGIYIADKNGDSLLNGSGLNPCSYTTQQAIHGLDIQQADMFLPLKGLYYLIHFSLDTNGPRPGTMYYTVIDPNDNFGLGRATDKNHVFYKEIFRGGGMTACKHANGRDWWIVIGRANTNRFYKFLLTPSGITDTSFQNIGPVYNGPFDIAYSCFSEDGSKYVTGTIVGLITVLDFDRCTGEFSNPITISNKVQGFTAPGTSSIAFSPNGRYIYAATRVDLKQYDLTNANIQDSVIVYQADSGDFAQLNILELGPNGKLYGSTWNGGFTFLHVINKPDEKGDSCEFVFGGQPTLSANSFNLPNMPNYRLGSLVGSGCDTITDVKSEIQNIGQPRIQPNPADKFVYVEMPIQGEYIYELMNEVGQLIERKETKQVDIINVEGLPSGLYFLYVYQHSKELSTNKIIVQH